jgi:hypothetical protein
MARSRARNKTAQVRPSTSSPPQQLPGAPTSSCVNPSPQPQQFPGAPASSSANHNCESVQALNNGSVNFLLDVNRSRH